MNEQIISQWEQKIQETAAALTYPETPDIAGAVQRRLATPRPQPARRRQRLAWAVALVVLLLAGLLTVPQVRAAVWRIFRIGAVTIFEGDVAETAVPATATSVNDTEPLPTSQILANDTLFRLAGETTLTQAQATVDFPLKRPSYPTGLGPPDAVYHQQINVNDGSDAVIMVWFDPEAPEQVRLVLYQIQADAYLNKTARTVAETAVHDAPAVWIEGPHLVQLQNGDYETWLAVDGNVLVWTEGDITYRLESMASRGEAVRMAESLTALTKE